MEENLINAPVSRESETEKAARIKRFGVQTKARLVYRLEPKWPEEKKRTALEKNEGQAREAAALKEEYGIAHLFDERLSAKGGEYFRAGTPEEEERLAQYRRRRTELEERMIRLPDFDGDKYSFFFVSASGLADEFHSVFPPEASAEAYRILGFSRR